MALLVSWPNRLFDQLVFSLFIFNVVPMYRVFNDDLTSNKIIMCSTRCKWPQRFPSCWRTYERMVRHIKELWDKEIDWHVISLLESSETQNQTIRYGIRVYLWILVNFERCNFDGLSHFYKKTKKRKERERERERKERSPLLLCVPGGVEFIPFLCLNELCLSFSYHFVLSCRSLYVSNTRPLPQPNTYTSHSD